ncbi:MAG TPA: hypothetical protein VGQ17_09675 [Gemmatimonadales bacterium]|jgi:hypothetical protein|nr:hypothetical protein [Gemmatimonadales bacterium]
MPARRAFPGLALLLTLAACAPRPAPVDEKPLAAAVDSAAVKAAVAGLWQKMIASDTAEDVAGVAALISEKGRFDERGVPPMLGRAAWQATAEPAMKGRDVMAFSVRPEMTMAITNDLAYELGTYSETSMDRKTKKTSTDYGRYATAIGKEPDGQWRFSYLMAFVDSTVAVRK